VATDTSPGLQPWVLIRMWIGLKDRQVPQLAIRSIENAKKMRALATPFLKPFQGQRVFAVLTQAEALGYYLIAPSGGRSITNQAPRNGAP
jgi:hypothetical protein